MHTRLSTPDQAAAVFAKIEGLLEGTEPSVDADGNVSRERRLDSEELEIALHYLGKLGLGATYEVEIFSMSTTDDPVSDERPIVSETVSLKAEGIVSTTDFYVLALKNWQPVLKQVTEYVSANDLKELDLLASGERGVASQSNELEAQHHPMGWADADVLLDMLKALWAHSK